MIKALLMVTSINLGSVDTVLPSMKDCMNARDAIIEQETDAKVLCVPYTKEQSKSDDMRAVSYTHLTLPTSDLV